MADARALTSRQLLVKTHEAEDVPLTKLQKAEKEKGKKVVLSKSVKPPAADHSADDKSTATVSQPSTDLL